MTPGRYMFRSSGIYGTTSNSNRPNVYSKQRSSNYSTSPTYKIPNSHDADDTFGHDRPVTPGSYEIQGIYGNRPVTPRNDCYREHSQSVTHVTHSLDRKGLYGSRVTSGNDGTSSLDRRGVYGSRSLTGGISARSSDEYRSITPATYSLEGKALYGSRPLTPGNSDSGTRSLDRRGLYGSRSLTLANDSIPNDTFSYRSLDRKGLYGSRPITPRNDNQNSTLTRSFDRRSRPLTPGNEATGDENKPSERWRRRTPSRRTWSSSDPLYSPSPTRSGGDDGRKSPMKLTIFTPPDDLSQGQGQNRVTFKDEEKKSPKEIFKERQRLLQNIKNNIDDSPYRIKLKRYVPGAPNPLSTPLESSAVRSLSKSMSDISRMVANSRADLYGADTNLTPMTPQPHMTLSTLSLSRQHDTHLDDSYQNDSFQNDLDFSPDFDKFDQEYANLTSPVGLNWIPPPICRQNKLDEALLSSGRFSDALASLLEWLGKAEAYLSEDQPILGDLDTVNILIEQHKVSHLSCLYLNQIVEIPVLTLLVMTLVFASLLAFI